MGNRALRATKATCKRLQDKANQPSSWQRDRTESTESVEPCYAPFPAGLGPLSVRDASLSADNVILDNVGAPEGGTLFVARDFFERQPALAPLMAELDAEDGWQRVPRDRDDLVWEGGENEPIRSRTALMSLSSAFGPALALRMSPCNLVTLPQVVSSRLGLTSNEELHFAWVYPWVPSSSERDNSREDEVEHDGEGLDADNPDASFLTVGGYIYLRRTQPSRSPKASASSCDRSAGLEFFRACAIRFSVQGALQFSPPRRWESRWTSRFVAQGRFRPITARKWLEAGARYCCWVRPEELIPDSAGHDHALVHHGGFAFLFHELHEVDVANLDRYFEVVAAPDLRPQSGERERSRPSLARLSSTSLPFVPAYAQRCGSGVKAPLRRLLSLAEEARWPLVRHLLAEYPFLAAEHGDGGTTLLHACARRNLRDAELLTYLREKGACHDALDDEGRTPEVLGDTAFRTMLRNVWQLCPDLFDNPEAWFSYLDRRNRGTLDVDELGNALSSAYRCDSIGSQWIMSYLHIHHSHGITKQEFLDEHGLFHCLQVSEEFVGLRQQRRLPLFRPGLRPLNRTEQAQLLQLEERIDKLRSRSTAPRGASQPRRRCVLQMPAPCAEGSVDPEARLLHARMMLGFSFEQTRGVEGHDWLAGFTVDFAGQEGLDDGGLTKAWAAEIAFALWGDDALFDVGPTSGTGFFFKPDEVSELTIDGASVASVDLYRWTGRFVAYVMYQRCLMDCRLSAWAFRALHRAASARNVYPSQFQLPDWPDTAEGEDLMLDDVASLDAVVANNLWRVRHEMVEEELEWLDFTYAGMELMPDGADTNVTLENRSTYVRLVARLLLIQRCRAGLQAFAEGFLDVVPSPVLSGLPEEAPLRLVAGVAEVTDLQLDELEGLVIPGGLVPTRLCDHRVMRKVASWVFAVARSGDAAFRSRLLEFWIGVGRVPLAGMADVRPKPRLQIMVQQDPSGGVRRIASWPRERLPEGHTCGNELWIALPDSYEGLEAQLRTAVGNFEAGFALR
eukprot:TRINITY_DN12739_c0_g1_i1.p1 TRINITY_DN12739_c0_g1~~TRINITY_DN12739_c0_g1_i1.p1  ORF type:complete len:1034 (+),score=135.27 TRINITY_DN12739_c0_g1_i1:46-3102(+)